MAENATGHLSIQPESKHNAERQNIIMGVSFQWGNLSSFTGDPILYLLCILTCISEPGRAGSIALVPLIFYPTSCAKSHRSTWTHASDLAAADSSRPFYIAEAYLQEREQVFPFPEVTSPTAPRTKDVGVSTPASTGGGNRYDWAVRCRL